MVEPQHDIVLEVKDLSTWFETRHETVKAVDHVSMTLRRGRTLCVVGESGSGKSVTARSILNIVPKPGRIVGGQVLLHGSTLEQSNVSPADASVRLVSVMRQFEMLQRALTLGAEMNRKAVEEVARVS